ncbi:MAG: hypothetical protein CMI79_00695 [Candidatus Pelagibacter sp.]|nr:hypothetical protein [Candidatus Pelagibacter sp.]
MKKRIYLLIIILLSFATIIGFAEIYLRYVGLGDPIVYDRNYVYGYAPKINQKKKRLNESIVSINDVGLRSIENWKDKKNYKKIIFYGDSVTYGGSYIDDKETFVYFACNKFKNTNFLCGNAGVNSYGIHNIIYRAKYDKRIKDPDFKVFIVVPDDFYRGLQNSQTAHFYLNEKKFILPAIFEAVNFIATKYDLNNYISKLDDTRIDDNKIDLINETIKFIKSEFSSYDEKEEKYLTFYIHPKKKNKNKQLYF